MLAGKIRNRLVIIFPDVHPVRYRRDAEVQQRTSAHAQPQFGAQLDRRVTRFVVDALFLELHFAPYEWNTGKIEYIGQLGFERRLGWPAVQIHPQKRPRESAALLPARQEYARMKAAHLL